MNFEEKYLPNQIFNRNLFSGKKNEYEKKLYFKNTWNDQNTIVYAGGLNEW